MEDSCYVIVNNIPSSYRSCDLRNFFSEFVETSAFCCFHFRHRPEVQKHLGDNGADDFSPSTSSTSNTCCCVVKMCDDRRVDDFIRMYHRKHWVDRKGHMMPRRCFIKKISLPDNVEGQPASHEGDENISSEETTFTRDDLSTLIEMQPPTLMPNGNVGTPTKYFLEQIKACRLPSSIITKLKLEFPHTRSKRLYSSVNYNYGGRRYRGRNTEESLVRTSKGQILSEKYVDDHISSDEESAEVSRKSDEEEEEQESEEEEWDRHESLHNDVTQQERLKERLFEEKIELKWEKGGSGLVFYTDAQYWDEKEGDFDAKTADDWDIDTSGYYERGAGDKDSRDALRMRLEERLRQGIYVDKTDVNDFAGFEKYSKGFGRKVLEAQGWKQGQGIGKTVIGMAEPVLDVGQNPRDKKGFGYRGEKLKRHMEPKRRRRNNDDYDDDDDSRIRISTIYDNPETNDPPERLLRSSFLTKLKYRQEFLKENSKEDV